MRIPHIHKLQLSPVNTPESTVTVKIDPSEYIDDIGLFEDKKEYVKWIYRMKTMIRHSFEYTDLISFIKRKHGMDHCGIHPNLTIWDGHKIEAHHTPFTITDIISIVTKKRMDRNESLKMNMIAREVMELHYLELIGLYGLCQLCHAFAHSEDDSLFIPLECVWGDPEKFYSLYEEYMTEPMRVKWSNILQINKGYNLITSNIPIELQKKYIYIKPQEDSDLEVISTNKLVGFLNDLNKAG